MYCKNCGKEVLETSIFCSNCGKRIGEEDAGLAKKKIHIARKVGLVIALLAVLLLGGVVIYLNVMKKDIHVESIQWNCSDGVHREIEIDSKDKKIKLDGIYTNDNGFLRYGMEATYCINNNEIEFSEYDEEGKLQKVAYKFKTENKGKTVYLYPDDEDREGYVWKMTIEENAFYFYLRDAYGELQYAEKIEENRIICTGGESSSGGFRVSGGSYYYETEKNKLKLYAIAEDGSCSSTPGTIITATDKIEGEKDIIELLQEDHIIDYFLFGL